MGQARERRGDRRRHASPVKRLTQAKTTRPLIQCLSLRGMVTAGPEPPRTNVAKSTDLQHQTAAQGTRIVASTWIREPASAPGDPLPFANACQLRCCDASDAFSCTPAD